MKKKKIPFAKDVSLIIKEINTKLPLDLKDLYPIVEKIHFKYPLVSIVEISQTIFNIFESMRELLLEGKVIKINKYFKDMEMIAYSPCKKSIILRIKMKTPKDIRNLNGS